MLVVRACLGVCVFAYVCVWMTEREGGERESMCVRVNIYTLFRLVYISRHSSACSGAVRLISDCHESRGPH